MLRIKEYVKAASLEEAQQPGAWRNALDADE